MQQKMRLEGHHQQLLSDCPLVDRCRGDSTVQSSIGDDIDMTVVHRSIG